MNNIIQPSRRVQYVLRDTTQPQHLPINAPRRRKVNPLVFIAVYAASGLTVFALIAIIINL